MPELILLSKYNLGNGDNAITVKTRVELEVDEKRAANI
jgi:hypothetical protein